MTFDYGEVLHSVIIMSIGLGVAFFASYGDVMSVIQFSGSNGENYQVWQNIARSIVAIVVGVGVLYVFVNVTWTVAHKPLKCREDLKCWAILSLNSVGL